MLNCSLHVQHVIARALRLGGVDDEYAMIAQAR
jgi:hypothetical protein